MDGMKLLIHSQTSTMQLCNGRDNLPMLASKFIHASKNGHRTTRVNGQNYVPQDTLAVDSLWTGEGIWRHRFGSTLAQVMAWCRQASSHYPNQCWLFTKGIPLGSPATKFTRAAQSAICVQTSKITFLELLPHLPRASEFNVRENGLQFTSSSKRCTLSRVFTVKYQSILPISSWVTSLFFTALLKPRQIPMFLHKSARVQGHRWYPQTWEK